MEQNPWNLSPQQVDQLLKLAGARLGVDPQTLRSQLEQGSLESLKGPDNQQIQELLSDPKRLRQAMGGESAKGLLGSLLGPKGR
ncbi:MAG TPA: hypothetical protein H9680_01705 [Firmicutes bacterium]|nr:hypothetical protein [Bacillota bacterium]